MQIKKAPVKDLVSPEWNPRQITDEELEKLKTSLEEFGYIEPIIINDVNNHVVGGNQRLRALIALGYDEVDCVYVHIEDINKEKACNVALNKISGDWDTDKLKIVLEDIELSPLDIKLTGFDELELTELEVKEPITVHEDDFIIEDEEDMEVNVKEGDLYRLGEHYLLCGDSTVEANVKKLMQGAKAKLLFTSPPYADLRDYNSTEEELEVNNIIQFIPTYKDYTDYQVINLGLIYRNHEIYPYWNEYLDLAKENGLKLLSWNVWNRTTAGSIGQQQRMFPLYHEWIFVFGTEPLDLNRTIPKQEDQIGITGQIRHRQKDGTIKYHNVGDTSNPYKKMGSVITAMYECRQVNHPAPFPVILPSEYIKAMTKEGDAVIDCFGGSGTTMIACEQLNRKCYMMEYSPEYCQVIINRWEEYTGQKAEKLPL